MHRLFALLGLFVLCFALGAAPLAYAKEDAAPQSDVVVKPNTPPEVNSREGFLPEFPGRYFGMSREEVIKLEGQPEGGGSAWEYYDRELNNTPWVLIYIFDNEKLAVFAYDYVFSSYKPGQPMPFDEYQRWADWLKFKYGPPLKHYRFWGEKPAPKELARTKELEVCYWEVKGITIQLAILPPKFNKLSYRNNKPYMQILYYIED